MSESSYGQGYIRAAACSFPVALAQPGENAAAIAQQFREAAGAGAVLAVFPELCLTGYSLDDLFMQQALIDATLEAVAGLAAATQDVEAMLIVGAPLHARNRLYNCAIAICKGEILGAVPKSYLPNYREFYEHRQFASGVDVDETVAIGGQQVRVSTAQLFAADGLFTLGVEICEDLWVPVSPGALAVLAGANVIANLSGSPITVGKARERKLLAQAASATGLSAYVYAAAGAGESSTDLAWDGQTFIYECGELLAEGERFAAGNVTTYADIDMAIITQNRLRQGTFDDNRQAGEYAVRTVPLVSPDVELSREVARRPFVPDDPARLDQDCYEAYHIQVSALLQRLRAIGQPKVVIGVSGGLDSSHALIVAAKAMDLAGRPRTDVLAFTMPGFATSAETKANATALATALGVTFDELDIRPAATQMLNDLGHPLDDYDVTFENVQAGLRTDYLFRIANQRGGIVLGTGDLSELALGWCTYGVGDQMAHYNINSGVPKTLIQHLIAWVISSRQFDDAVGHTLQAILDTEITPELVPVAAGEQPQSTQAAIGPYELQDFNLFYTLRYGLTPAQIRYRACHAWAGVYTPAEIDKWLRVFIQRFFGFSQFKRSAMPNGPKVVRGGALSPRGDWRMPSDTSAALWLAGLESQDPESGR
ncbi:MAG: NAD(+) synthase [Propionibacteriaceae bacterium]|nr:NAD(+) synthase [Propionibacteriaceae bacterium]